VDLAKLARLLPAAVLAPWDLVGETPRAWAAAHDVIALAATDIGEYRFAGARDLTRVAEARLPLAGAENARVIAFRPGDGGLEHLALVIGAPKRDGSILVRLHSECFTGDHLGSLRCDCGDQLHGAIEAIHRAGAGVLLYLSQEGRGIGLVNKLRAYQLQDRGADTAEANEQLGFDADERIYLPAAGMLRQLGFARVRLLTNNPHKVAALARCGITVEERVPHAFPSNGHNDFYLATKAARFGHRF
jgi:GTP cyclohydrolase II